MDNGGCLTVICAECWRQISDFNNFQQIVYQAQLKLQDTEQEPMIKSENDFTTMDANKYTAQNVVRLNDQEVYIKTEENLTEENTDQYFGSYSGYGIIKQEENAMSTTNQNISEVNVKTEDYRLPNENNDTLLREQQIGDFIIQAKEEPSLALPKLEIMDVFSDDDGSQEAMSDESDNDEAGGEFDYRDDSMDGSCLSADKRNKHPSQPKDALTKKKLIEESDEFIKQWDPNLACIICNEPCSTYSLLRQHFLDLHPYEKCYIMCCQRKFYQRYVIEDHIRHHMNPNAFKCELCDKRHTTRRQLADHMRNHHSTTGQDTKNTAKRKVTTDQELDELIAQWKPILECAVCKDTFTTLKSLQMHFRDNHPQWQFYIECCYRKLKKRYDIEDHARNHINPITFACELCSCPFSTQSNLMRHMRTQHSKANNEEVKHSNKKRITDKELEDLVARWKPKLECVVCQITCTTLKRLQVHFRQNHPLKQFYIECCHRKFKRRYDIEFHARNHVDPITFTCEICTNRFSTQSNLMRHIRIYHSNAESDAASNSNVTTTDQEFADNAVML